MTEALLEGFQQILANKVAVPVFWLALAVTQWRLGRLEDRTKASANEVIENGTALRAWQSAIGRPAESAGEGSRLAEFAATKQDGGAPAD